ncbi:ABC transporter family substrate-binding protein [Streptomyces orinoci]|uniref:ABC transporter family substrate-binding protein n=1 Tax=Streptomyces orinoci TaxID=67339 RepID=A0ABV3JSU5_STRON|nr:ABC transporter family substrate-binding protein [Streptomyces orinoci]
MPFTMSFRVPRSPGSVRPRRAAALLLAAALLPLPLLAGCSSDDGRAEDPGAPPDIAAAPRAKVADRGTLTWAVDALPATLNTFQADADRGTAQVAGAVLPALFTLDRQGRPQRNPDYLRSVRTTEQDSRQVVVYRLNPGAVWSDGKPVTAADFQGQWKALRGKDSSFWAAHNAGYERIEQVARGADDREVRVTFNRPYADWPALFTPLYPRSVTGDGGAFNDSARHQLALSAGPFKFQERDEEQGTLTLVRNPRWWGERAKLDKLVLRAVPRDKRAAELAAGRLDLAEITPAVAARIGRDNAPARKENADDANKAAPSLRGLAVRRSLEPGYTQLALNGASGPLADERVRRAVARAVDRKGIAELVLGPLGLPARPLGSHVRVAGQQGYQDNSDALGSSDPHAARDLLAEAGWKEGPDPANPPLHRPGQAGPNTVPRNAHHPDDKGVRGRPAPRAVPDEITGDGASGPELYEDHKDPGGRVVAAPARYKDGKKLVLRFVLPKGADSEPLREVGERIARELDGIGIRTEITKVEDAGFFKDHIASGDFDLALYSWPVGAFPATEARPIFAKPRPAADGSLQVEQNYTRVGTDQIDHLFDQASAELDGDAARDLVQAADARIWAAAASVPLYQRPQLVAVRATVANAGAFGLATPRYQDIGFHR